MGPRDTDQNADEYYARTYDQAVSDWPGEIEFYLQMAERAKATSGCVLELACGTGRIAIRLAQAGVDVVGLDLSPEMLNVARRKSATLGDLRWVEGDMRSFELGQVFDLVLIPGHSFQGLNTPPDQLRCLESVKRHLRPAGALVLHLDHMGRENVKWLGSICGEKKDVFQAEETFTHPETGRQTRALRAWSYEPSTQTAVVRTAWEELGVSGEVVHRVERGPIRLHCVFRLEMEHLLARAGYVPQAVYGDFFRGELLDDSPSMIWVAELT